MKDWEYRNMQEKIAADQTDRIINEMRAAEHRASRGSGSAASSNDVGIPWGTIILAFFIWGTLMGDCEWLGIDTGWLKGFYHFWRTHIGLSIIVSIAAALILKLIKWFLFDRD